MGNNNLSGSEFLHQYLCEHRLGYTFTYNQMEKISINGGYTSGVASGFIARALKKGMIQKVGTQKGNRRPQTIYALIDYNAWKFHGPSGGSAPGRTIKGSPHQIDDETMHYVGGLHSEEPKEEIPTCYTLKCTDDSLADQLVQIAAKVNQMENKQEKTLADYSTDELLAEIKRRTEFGKD